MRIAKSIFGFVTFMILNSCAAFGAPATQERAAAAVFGAEHLACVQKASTKAESQECRKAVDAKWGVK